MQSLRSLILVATITLAAAPALHADVMGTNPRPHALKSVSFAQTVLSCFGF